MKLAFFNDDEAWFWILDETGRFWECWYENDFKPPVRLEELDRTAASHVAELIEKMALDAQDTLANA
jgi:hypothetical protein